VTGISIVPPCPVHLQAQGETVRWVRRSRNGWRWIDGVDAPLGEESELYRVTIAPVGGIERTEEIGVATVALSAEDRELGCSVTVRQTGAHGLSPPATIELPPSGDG
jgi:hypothetical protein